MAHRSQSDADPLQYEVAICGAGPTGLTLSILLSRFGIRHLVIDRRDSVSAGVPRARGINHRTGEIWQLFGLGADLRRMTLAPEWLERMVYQETLAGPLIGTVETPSNLPGASSHLTPSDTYCISQDRTDAMLAGCAASHQEATLRFGTTLVAATQYPDSVDITLQTRAGQESIRTRWLVGCDGTNSDVRAGAGMVQTRLATLDSFVNAHFVADLDRWTDSRKAVLLWNMQEGLEGVFGAIGRSTLLAVPDHFRSQQGSD
jgi:putative polyketide hydroxylase